MNLFFLKWPLCVQKCLHYRQTCFDELTLTIHYTDSAFPANMFQLNYTAFSITSTWPPAPQNKWHYSYIRDAWPGSIRNALQYGCIRNCHHLSKFKNRSHAECTKCRDFSAIAIAIFRREKVAAILYPFPPQKALRFFLATENRQRLRFFLRFFEGKKVPTSGCLRVRWGERLGKPTGLESEPFEPTVLRDSLRASPSTVGRVIGKTDGPWFGAIPETNRESQQYSGTALPLRFGWRQGHLRQKIAAICDCDFWCSSSGHMRPWRRFQH